MGMRGAILHSVLDFIAVQARAALADGNRPMIRIRRVLARVKISSCSIPLKLVFHDIYFCRIVVQSALAGVLRDQPLGRGLPPATMPNTFT